MKRALSIFLVIIIMSLFSSFTYAGIIDFPRPDSIDPITIVK